MKLFSQVLSKIFIGKFHKQWIRNYEFYFYFTGETPIHYKNLVKFKFCYNGGFGGQRRTSYGIGRLFVGIIHYRKRRRSSLVQLCSHKEIPDDFQWRSFQLAEKTRRPYLSELKRKFRNDCAGKLIQQILYVSCLYLKVLSLLC